MPFPGGIQGGIPIFKNFLGGIDFSLNLALNRGAAWGFFSEFQMPLLILRIIIVCALLIYLFFINVQKNMCFPLVLIITGAIGNITDFFLYGSVVDFFLVTFWGWHFPLFNLADSLITIGVIIILFLTFFDKTQIHKAD